MKKTLLALTAVLMISKSFAANPYEIEFKAMGTVIKGMIASEVIQAPEQLRNIDEYRFTLALEFTQIELKRKELKDKFGRVKCALNFPEKNLIQINKNCWEKMRSDLTLAYPLVLHEYLGIMGDEVDNYDISKHMFELTKKWIAKRQKEEKIAIELKAAKNQEMRQLQISVIAPKVAVLKYEDVKVTYEDLIKYPTLKEIRAFKMSDVLLAFDTQLELVMGINNETGTYLCDRMGFNLFVRTTISSSQGTYKSMHLSDDDLTLRIYDSSYGAAVERIQCSNK